MEKAVVDQLLFELNRDRMKVSEAAQQLVSFTENHQSKDHLGTEIKGTCRRIEYLKRLRIYGVKYIGLPGNTGVFLKELSKFTSDN